MTGAWNFYASPAAAAITSGQATLAAGSWHNLKLVFQGSSIKGAIDGTQVFSVTDSKYSKGNVGLGTAAKTTALFDNLIVNTVNGAKPAPTVFVQDGQSPPDGGAGGSGGTAGSTGTGGAAGTGGTSRTGGSTGAGGSLPTGGLAATGGRTSTGGVVSAGGTVGTGANTGAGGSTRTGGATATGGSTGLSSMTSSGGTSSPPALGGITEAGGTTAVAGITGTPGGASAGGNPGSSANGGVDGEVDAGNAGPASAVPGCSCSIGRRNQHDHEAGLAVFLALAAAPILYRRRRVPA